MVAYERERLARAHFRSFCRSFLDRAVLWWGSRERVVGMIRLEGLEHLRALNGAPALLACPALPPTEDEYP